jgi:hypothetical protein
MTLINPNLTLIQFVIVRNSRSIRVYLCSSVVKLSYNMKSAYELAMERLNKTSPTVKFTTAQKKELAELDSKYAAKVAEREIALKSDMDKAIEAGDPEKLQKIRQQLADDKRKLQSELEDKKDRIRDAK